MQVKALIEELQRRDPEALVVMGSGGLLGHVYGRPTYYYRADVRDVVPLQELESAPKNGRGYPETVLLLPF